jgi:hypothetical protein
MKQLSAIIAFIMSAIMIAACSSSDKINIKPTGTAARAPIAVAFPQLDTATLWFYANGHITTDYARIDTNGNMTITSSNPALCGNYIVRLTDSPGTHPVLAFKLSRAGVDTVISYGNGMGIKTVGSQSYLWMLIDGGNLPIGTILRGQYMDSL